MSERAAQNKHDHTALAYTSYTLEEANRIIALIT